MTASQWPPNIASDLLLSQKRCNFICGQYSVTMKRLLYAWFWFPFCALQNRREPDAIKLRIALWRPKESVLLHHWPPDLRQRICASYDLGLTRKDKWWVLCYTVLAVFNLSWDVCHPAHFLHRFYVVIDAWRFRCELLFWYSIQDSPNWSVDSALHSYGQ